MSAQGDSATLAERCAEAVIEKCTANHWHEYTAAGRSLAISVVKEILDADHATTQRQLAEMREALERVERLAEYSAHGADVPADVADCIGAIVRAARAALAK